MGRGEEIMPVQWAGGILGKKSCQSDGQRERNHASLMGRGDPREEIMPVRWAEGTKFVNV